MSTGCYNTGWKFGTVSKNISQTIEGSSNSVRAIVIAKVERYVAWQLLEDDGGFLRKTKSNSDLLGVTTSARI